MSTEERVESKEVDSPETVLTRGVLKNPMLKKQLAEMLIEELIESDKEFDMAYANTLERLEGVMVGCLEHIMGDFIVNHRGDFLGGIDKDIASLA